MAVMAQERVNSDIPAFSKEMSLEASAGLVLLDCKPDAPVATIATPVVTRM
jgi:hypothetical protein